jgi:hypothetical protein
MVYVTLLVAQIIKICELKNTRKEAVVAHFKSIVLDSFRES